MSRTKHKIPKYKKGKKPNPYGVCNCEQCRRGRMGKKSSVIIRIKRRLRNWWNNKPEIRGGYTD